MISFALAYKNRTPNKKRRQPGQRVRGVVWHETAGYGALAWCLRPEVRASFNYLIDRAGVIWLYVDEAEFVAWHAGINSFWDELRNGALNWATVGVELEGPNDGTPITAAQFAAAVALMRYLNARHHLTATAEHHRTHAAVTTGGYKSDPRGLDLATLLAAAGDARPDVPVLGVPQSVSYAAFARSLTRNRVRWTAAEQLRAYTFCRDWELDAAFLLAVWKYEGDFGRSELQRQTHCPINIKAAPGEWRPTVAYRDAVWIALPDDLIGWHVSVLHIKALYGPQGKHTVRTIIPALAPKGDGANNPERYIASVLEDMAYIRAH